MTEKLGSAGSVPGGGQGVAPRRYPRGTVVLMALAIFVALLSLVDWTGQGAPRGWIFLPVPIGFAGALWALCSRRLDVRERIGWALFSFFSGFAPFFLVMGLGTLLLGP
ncbi:hypothetical protein [Auraticoccus monumenti]|uniref:Uncharacterized protein n=1 Tax=Auraticoccus monumenti TaxID=675864 RepID=A0A1G7BIY5_9ACTN|nr:hypothetical protein [Auraticoccus monumenti]SDE26943.1 hypothetical protein SAMN04489747_2973 [Auraticoccus monumenti]